MNRWILEMREYNYEINYLKGKDNIVAEHLSRPVRVVMRPPETSWLGSGSKEETGQPARGTVLDIPAHHVRASQLASPRLLTA